MRKIEITTLKLNYIVYWKERRGAHLQSQTKVVGKVLYNLTVVHFNPEKREFSLSLNNPRPLYPM